jgi:hypothetical protein
MIHVRERMAGRAKDLAALPYLDARAHEVAREADDA